MTTWLMGQLSKLSDVKSNYKQEIGLMKEIDPKKINDFSTEATPLKLIFLNYALDIYTKIIKKNFENMFYIDLFSGSGITQIKKNKSLFIGSPAIAALLYNGSFTKHIFCDMHYLSTLKKRLEAININNYETCQGDCNKSIDKILEKIDLKKSHAFFFVDPQAMEFEWESMEKILGTHCDILFTFMNNSINRARNAAFANPQLHQNTLDKFFGGGSWRDKTKEVLDIYKEKIKNVRDNAVIEDIKVLSYYNMVFITNKTRGNNPWMRGIKQAKKEIEMNPKSAVKVTIDKLTSGQKEISDW